MERVTGIEPVLPAWKADTLAIVLYAQKWCSDGNSNPDYQSENLGA